MSSARRWWKALTDGRLFEEVFDVLPRDVRHITLSLIERAAVEVSIGQVQQLRDAIAHHTARFAPFELRIGPAIVNTVAIELYIAPDPTLTALRDAVADAYRDVFGPDAQPEPRNKPWRGHTSLGYCRRAFGDEGLASALLRTPGPRAGYLGPATIAVAEVLLVEEDTFSPDGLVWNLDTAHRIPVALR